MLHKWEHQLRAALQPLQATNKRSKLLSCLVTSNPCHITQFSKLHFSGPSVFITRANKVQERPFQPLLVFTLEPQSKHHRDGEK